MSSTNSVNIDLKNLVPAKQAADYFAYSSDHICRLAKEKKIVGMQYHRAWLVQPQSIKNYLETKQLELSVHHRQLKQTRQQELYLREKITLASTHRPESAGKRNFQACTLAALLVCLALFVVDQSGLQLHFDSLTAAVSSASSIEQITSAQSEYKNTKVEIIQPIFSDDGGVVSVDATGRKIVAPEITPKWVQITP